MSRTGIPMCLTLLAAGSLSGLGGGAWPFGSRSGASPSFDVDAAIAFEPVRAAVYLSYRKINGDGIGSLKITNRGFRPASGLLLTVDLPDREDLLPEPFTAAVPDLDPLETKAMKVFPRLSPAILGEKTSELRFRATVSSPGGTVAVRNALVPVIERSQVTWDKPERIAALIDPSQMMSFIRRALSRSPTLAEKLPVKNLRLASEVFDAILAWGLRYLEDSPPARDQALLGVPVDRVNSPAETLADHAGDCDDLSVLLSSGLEAAGVPSAIGICENHVFVLLDLGVESPERSAIDPSWVLEHGGRSWIPLEATCLARAGTTIISSWSAGRERLKALRSGEARFFDVRKAWSDYPSVPATPEMGAPRPEALREGGPERSKPASPAVRPVAPVPAGSGAAEVARVLRDRVGGKAEEARRSDPVDGDRRAAAVFAEAGYRREAESLLRRALERKPDPGIRLDLAGLILSGAVGAGDIAAAKREVELALEGLDPLDLPSRDEAAKRLGEISFLTGTPWKEKPAAAPDRQGPATLAFAGENL